MAVEHLFEEFFSPYTSNTRKHEIEEQLSSFKSAPQLWKLCVYFISHTSSQYVTMFALQTLDAVINKHWSSTDWPTQEEIKRVLENNFIYKGNEISHFLRHKYAKLLVDIAKHDWPRKYPDFFDNITELLKSQESNQLIGLVLLRTTCEEFMGSNATFDNYVRKKELTRLLHTYIPVIFESLTNILEKLGAKPLHATTATPPPSPTHPTSAPSLSQQLATATFRPDHKTLNQEALNTVQYMFAWVPIEEIPLRIVRTIFSFTNISTYAQDDDDICVCAMSTINEIFYRKCSPPGSENFFKEIYDHTIDLLKNVTNSCTYRIDTCDEMFVQKLCELLVLILEQHLWRFEKLPNFSAYELLSLFFQFTMQLSSVPCYLRCLTVWTAFFKQVKQENAEKYSEVCRGLGTALVKKIQFTFNFSQLNQINNTDLDEDNKTEWQIFLEASIDVLALAAQYAPIEVFNQVLNSWNISNTVYRQLAGAVDHQNYSLTFEISETERLYYVLRDFSSLCFTLSSLAHLFYLNDDDDVNSTATPTIYMLIDNILQSASLAKSIRFYNLKLSNTKLAQCFIDIHSELLASLKIWLGWMDNKNQICSNVQVFLDMILPILEDGVTVPAKISNSAAHIFLEMARKPNNLNPITYPIVSRFIHLAPNLKFNNRETSDAVNSAICEILLRHLKAFEQEEFANKHRLIRIYFLGLTKEFKELTPNTEESRLQETVSNTLPLLSHIIEYCRGFSVVAKKELTSAIKETLDHALALFPTYVKYTEVHNQLSRFFIAVMKNLQSQIGIEFTKNAIQVFLQVAVSEQQANNLSGLQQLLDIFCIVVRESANKAFLPDILQLCMENIYPLLLPQAGENPDTFVIFLDLLHSILNFRWLYFYNSQVMLGYSPGGSESEMGPDMPKRPEQLLAILRVFGEALLQDDINIFRRSLVILQDLNHNKKLYHKGIFRSQFLPELLRVLLNTLLYKRQGLSCEDMLFGIYSMAEVDFDGFFSTFLPHYIQNLDGITAQQYEMLIANFDPSNDRDAPSFLQHLQNFATDFQHYRACNMGSGIN